MNTDDLKLSQMTLSQRQQHLDLKTGCMLPAKPRKIKSRNALKTASQLRPSRNWVCMHACESDSYHGGCCNPQHIYWGTQKENLREFYRGGYSQSAEGVQRAIECKQKKSELMTGKSHTVATRAKMSATHTGKPKSDEHRANLSESQKRSWARRR